MQICFSLYCKVKIGTCESKIFFRIKSRIEPAATIQIESRMGVVVYVFNADCHRSCVGLLLYWFLKQYCTIAPTVLASVYALDTDT